MRRVVYPPIKPRPVEFLITRRRWGRKLLFTFPWGESWWLRSPDAATYLKMLGDSDPGLSLDLVWNFRAVHYAVDAHEALVVPPSTVEEVLSSTTFPAVVARG